MENGDLWDRQMGELTWYVPYMEFAKTSRNEAEGKPQISHKEDASREDLFPDSTDG